RRWSRAADGARRLRGLARSRPGVQRLPGRARRVPAADRSRVRHRAPAAGGRGRGRGGCRAGQPRAPGSLRRPEPTAPGQGHERRAAPGAARVRAAGRVLALDGPGMLDDAFSLREFTPGDGLEVGPFGVRSWLLPHWMPNAGLRLEADGQVLAYTGDSGPSPLL